MFIEFSQGVLYHCHPFFFIQFPFQSCLDRPISYSLFLMSTNSSPLPPPSPSPPPSSKKSYIFTCNLHTPKDERTIVEMLEDHTEIRKTKSTVTATHTPIPLINRIKDATLTSIFTIEFSPDQTPDVETLMCTIEMVMSGLPRIEGVFGTLKRMDDINSDSTTKKEEDPFRNVSNPYHRATHGMHGGTLGQSLLIPMSRISPSVSPRGSSNSSFSIPSVPSSLNSGFSWPATNHRGWGISSGPMSRLSSLPTPVVTTDSKIRELSDRITQQDTRLSQIATMIQVQQTEHQKKLDFLTQSIITLTSSLQDAMSSKKRKSKEEKTDSKKKQKETSSTT